MKVITKQSHAMTKAQEIAILTATAAKLQSGYSGQWLAEQLPYIESAIRADMMPDCRATTLQEAEKCAAETIETAISKARAIVAKAEEEAAAIMEMARASVNDHLRGVLRTMDSAHDAIYRLQR